MTTTRDAALAAAPPSLTPAPRRRWFIALLWLVAAITAVVSLLAAWRVIDAASDGAGARAVAVMAAYLAVSLVWFSVGLFIGLARPDQPVARLAFASAMATGHVFIDVGVLGYGSLVAPLHVVLGFHFFCRFPSGPIPPGGWKSALLVLYVAGGVVVSAAIALPVLGMAGVPADADLVVILRAIRFRMGLAVFIVAVAAMLAVIPYKYRRLTKEDERRRVRFMAYGSLIALIPNIWYSVVAVQRPVGVALALFTNAASVLIPLCMAYVVMRHRVLDIRLVVRRGVQYLLARRVLQTALALPAIVLVVTIASQRHLTIAELVSSTRGYLFWLAASAVALRFRRPLEAAVDRRFFREAYDREQLLLGMLSDSARVDSLGELSALVAERLDASLHPTRTYVWYRDPREFASASSSHPHLMAVDGPANPRWLAWLGEQKGSVAVPLPDAAGLLPHERLWFAQRGIQIVVPIADSAEGLLGALYVGEKKSEDVYSLGDRQLLDAVARQAAVVCETLRLRARVHDEVRVRHDVLARLDGRLADLLKECPLCGACFDGPVERCELDGAPLTLSLPVARTIDGKYRLDRLIGKGGMGAVYEARDLRLDRIVAVKILSARAFGQPAALRRFRREAQAAAHLNHPNIVGVFDVGSLEGQGAYLVMERVQGMTLRAQLTRDGALAPPAVAEWFDPILDGIGAAHAQGMVHRDLKPENVMGHRAAAHRLAVKILDLGLVRFAADSRDTATMTQDGVIMGTLGYMSPEQLMGRPVDHRTDILAIGVMAIEALTNQRPPAYEAQAEFWRRLHDPAAAIAGAAALADVLRRCLSPSAAQRYQSAAALRDDLIPLLRTRNA